MTEKLLGDDWSHISDNIAGIRAVMAKAAVKSGRQPEDIELVAVTKTQPAAAINAALLCGIKTMGENRVQELLQKLPDIDTQDKSIHLIGHLQTNKVKSIIQKVDMIQSLDSIKLAQEIDRQAAAVGRVIDVLIEVNVGGEVSKSGIPPAEAVDLAEAVASFSHLSVKGLMSVPPICEKKEETRPYFAQMRKLFIDIASKKIDNNYMQILSMGMSSDFDIAIEEGSNMVRIGTLIFGKRKY